MFVLTDNKLSDQADLRTQQRSSTKMNEQNPGVDFCFFLLKLTNEDFTSTKYITFLLTALSSAPLSAPAILQPNSAQQVDSYVLVAAAP